jgi:hypothetical protein
MSQQEINEGQQENNEEQEVIVQKAMVETVVTVTFISATIFVLKAVAEAIAGWMGLTLFKKIVARYKRKKKDDQQLLEQESSAASQYSLSRGRYGGRVLRRTGKPHKP